MLCAWPLLRTQSELSKCVASTIVQAYSVPLHQLKVSMGPSMWTCYSSLTNATPKPQTLLCSAAEAEGKLLIAYMMRKLYL